MMLVHHCYKKVVYLASVWVAESTPPALLARRRKWRGRGRPRSNLATKIAMAMATKMTTASKITMATKIEIATKIRMARKMAMATK